MDKKAFMKMDLSQWWWCTPEIPTFGRLMQEDLKFELAWAT
jgi:hypothetical protein